MFRDASGSSQLAFLTAQPRARQAVEVALVVALALQASRLVWAALVPLGPVGEAGPSPASARAPGSADVAILSRFDPFSRGATEAVANAPAASDIKLFGVRADGRGGGSAILAGPDGKQAAYRIGEEVTPGVILAAVAADRVTLSRSGRRQALMFAQASVQPGYLPPPSPPAPPAAPPAPSEDLKAQAMTAAGLRPGDNLLSVNGTDATDPQRLAALGAELTSGREAVVRYERDGAVQTTTIRIP